METGCAGGCGRSRACTLAAPLRFLFVTRFRHAWYLWNLKSMSVKLWSVALGVLPVLSSTAIKPAHHTTVAACSTAALCLAWS